MNKLLLPLLLVCLHRIYCDDSGYGGGYGGGGGGGGYGKKSKVEKASFGLTLDMEKEDVYLDKDPGQLVLVLGDSGKKKPEYEEVEYKKSDDYHGGGSGYMGSDDYHGGGGGGGYHMTSSYGGHDSGYEGGSGYGGDEGYSGGHSGGGGYDGSSFDDDYGGGKSVYVSSGYGGGNGLVVSTGKYMSSAEYNGGHRGHGGGMAEGYSSKRYGTQKNNQRNRPNYRKRRLINDQNYASNHNLYSVHRMDGFIPNDNQYYYYN